MPSKVELAQIKRGEAKKRKLKREKYKRDHPDKSKQMKLIPKQAKI